MRRPRRTLSLAAGAFALCLGPAAVLADFETVAGSAPGQTGPFALGPVYGSVVLSFGHDSNLLLVPDAPPFHTGDQEGNFALASLTGGILFPVSDVLTFGAELGASLVRTFGQQPVGTPAFVTDPEDYSRFVLQPRLFARYQSGPLTLTPSLAYRQEGGSDVHAVGSDSLILRLDADWTLSPDTTLSAWAFRASTDFDVEFPGQPSRNRDGDLSEAGIAVRHAFDGNRRAVRLGLAMLRNDAEGRDWQFDGWRADLGVESHLGGRLYGALTASYSDRSYEGSFDDIIVGGRTDQQITDLGARVSYVLGAGRRIDLNATRSSISGNDPAFSGDRTVIGLSYLVTLQ